MGQLMHYFGNHKWLLLVVALLVFVSTGANIMGTYLLKPVINRFIMPGDLKGLAVAVAGMGLMYLCGVLATFGYNQLMVITGQKVVSEIRRDLFAHVQKLPLKYFDAHTHGELMSRFTNDVDTVQEALNNSFTMLIQSFLMVVGTITMLVVLSVRLSLIVVIFLAIMFAFIKFSGRRSRKYFQKQQEYLGRINGFVEEMVAGQKVEKVFNHEQEDFEEFCRRNEELRRASTSAVSYSSMMVPTIVSLSYANYAVSACVGGLFTIAGLLDIGSLASYLVYVRQSAMPLNQFTNQINFILAALSGAERIFEMMDEPAEIDEGTVTMCPVYTAGDGTMAEAAGYTGQFAWKVPKGVRLFSDGFENRSMTALADGGCLIPLKGRVDFKNVVFGYTKERQILNGISLYAKPGQKIAFVGSTGAGKTTIINLINRFYEIDDGQIIYDGIDIKDIRKDDLRRSLAMVVQETHLFTGTIADNIRYGRLDAADDEVKKAAAVANADSFIRRYDAVFRWRQFVAGTAAASGDCPGGDCKASGFDSGRGDQFCGYPDRAAY